MSAAFERLFSAINDFMNVGLRQVQNCGLNISSTILVFGKTTFERLLSLIS